MGNNIRRKHRRKYIHDGSSSTKPAAVKDISKYEKINYVIIEPKILAALELIPKDIHIWVS